MSAGLRRSGRLLSTAVALTWLGGAPAVAAPVSAVQPTPGLATPAGPGSWTVYHGDPAGTGVAAGVSTVGTDARAWTSPALDGQLYGEPLGYDGLVYVATENDTVYALSSATGKVNWSAHLGTPVPAGSLPCGNISPTVGITGTPVIDPSRNEIFVVADVVSGGHPAHVLVGLSTASGKVELRQDVDPPGADPAALLQRTGLALDGGQVVFGMGGNYGDCGSYRGRVVTVPESGGSPTFFTVDSAPGQREGAVWMGGAAPVIDGQGNIWVTTGNGSVTSPGLGYDNSDAVLELSSSLRLKQYFAPADWAAQNANDLDMSVAPVLLPDGQVLVAGKAGTAYLLDGSRLGGIGGQQATLGSACDTDVIGGAAVLGTTVFLPCLDGIVAVQASASPPGLRLLWKSGAGGGPPVVAAGLVWTMGQNGVLYGLALGTGKISQQVTLGPVANHFPTPSVADGLMLAICAVNVVAFHVQGATASQAPASQSPAAQAPVAQAPVTQAAATQSAAASPASSCRAYSPPSPGIPRRYIAAAALGGAAVVLAAALFARSVLRRRGRHHRLSRLTAAQRCHDRGRHDRGSVVRGTGHGEVYRAFVTGPPGFRRSVPPKLGRPLMARR